MGSFPKRCIFIQSQCRRLAESRGLQFRIKHSQPLPVKLQSEKGVDQMPHFAPETKCYYGLFICHCPLLLVSNEYRCSLCSAPTHFVSFYGISAHYFQQGYFPSLPISCAFSQEISVPVSVKV